MEFLLAFSLILKVLCSLSFIVLQRNAKRAVKRSECLRLKIVVNSYLMFVASGLQTKCRRQNYLQILSLNREESPTAVHINRINRLSLSCGAQTTFKRGFLTIISLSLPHSCTHTTHRVSASSQFVHWMRVRHVAIEKFRPYSRNYSYGAPPVANMPALILFFNNIPDNKRHSLGTSLYCFLFLIRALFIAASCVFFTANAFMMKRQILFA